MVCQNQLLFGEIVETFALNANGGLRYKGNLVVSKINNELKEAILAEAHNSKFSIHQGSTKMYHNLKLTYKWQGIKRDVT